MYLQLLSLPVKGGVWDRSWVQIYVRIQLDPASPSFLVGMLLGID